MKRFLTNCLRKCAAIALLLSPLAMQGQQAKIQNWRPYDQSGINVFESPKDSATSFDGLKVRIGAGFTQQFQSLKHSNTAGSPALYPRLKSGFNLAQANLNIDVQLADGIAITFPNGDVYPLTAVADKSQYVHQDSGLEVSFTETDGQLSVFLYNQTAVKK